MKKLIYYIACAAFAAGISNAADAHAHVSVNIGVGGWPAYRPVYQPPVYYAQPVYTPWPPVRYVPAPVVIYNGPIYRGGGGYWRSPYYQSYPYHYWRRY